MEQLAQRIQHIIDDREHGSRELVKQSLLLLRELAEEDASSSPAHLHTFYASAYRLAQARPAMAALSSAISRVISVYEGGLPAMAQEAEKLLMEADTATQK